MILIGLMVLVPLIAAFLLLLIKNDTARSIITTVAAAAIAVLSIALAVNHLGQGWTPILVDSSWLSYLSPVISIVVTIGILYYGFKHKNVLVIVLALIQVVASLIFEFVFAHALEVPCGLYTDDLSIIMVLIIGIIGSGICVYALGYMRDYQAHQSAEKKDRRNRFFALMFTFLSAMYVIVLSNNMSWMLTGWEVTTVCSFLLIAYTQEPQAIKNAFRQIIMNILGGLGFLAALYFMAINLGTLSLVDFIAYGIDHPAVVALPTTLLAFAGITKAAQMPFHTWLLGAMVAPTPTSALLHSSTMVKAGVFLLVKLSPLFLVCPAPAIMVMLVGGVTFLLCSFMAISQSNAKRVLAYSTIANLGLITACAGVGSPEAVWAAVVLIIFHAAAKSLLFLCVGTAEHHIGSRNIEDMDLLFDRMPRLARLMMIGIMCMFIAPLGMLIGKWATLVSFVDAKQVALILLLAFGSAATFMFWAKWLGKLSGIAGSPENVEMTVHKSEWIAQILMAVIALGASIGLPLLSQMVIEPYVNTLYDVPSGGEPLSAGSLWITSVLTVFTIVIVCGSMGRKKQKIVPAYLAGVAVDNDTRTFRNALSGETQATARNIYLPYIFGEAHLRPIGEVCCSVFIVVGLVVSCIGLFVPIFG